MIIAAISIYEWIRCEPTQRVTHCRGLLPQKLLARFAVNHDKLDTHFERLWLPTPTPQRGARCRRPHYEELHPDRLHS